VTGLLVFSGTVFYRLNLSHVPCDRLAPNWNRLGAGYRAEAVELFRPPGNKAFFGSKIWRVLETKSKFEFALKNISVSHETVAPEKLFFLPHGLPFVLGQLVWGEGAALAPLSEWRIFNCGKECDAIGRAIFLSRHVSVWRKVSFGSWGGELIGQIENLWQGGSHLVFAHVEDMIASENNGGGSANVMDVKNSEERPPILTETDFSSANPQYGHFGIHNGIGALVRCLQALSCKVTLVDQYAKSEHTTDYANDGCPKIFTVSPVIPWVVLILVFGVMCISFFICAPRALVEDHIFSGLLYVVVGIFCYSLCVYVGSACE